MVWRVNGERMFVKGVSLGPQDRFLGSMDTGVIADDLRSVRDAGLDLVRVHGHVARSELYEAADRQGVLLWQDLPSSARTPPPPESWPGASPAYGRPARAPSSVAVWCAHDEPNGPPLPEPNRSADRTTNGARLGRHLFPSWNRSVLDPLLRCERSARRHVTIRDRPIRQPAVAHRSLGLRSSPLAGLAFRHHEDLPS
ncbi:MAG: hypothetical protein R2710_02675 [Acidimicrobiales bacterium]